VREVGGGSTRYAVELDGRPVFDFLVTLSHDEDDLSELQPEDRKWLMASRQALTRQQRALVEHGPRHHDSPNLGALPVNDPTIVDGADLARTVRKTDPVELASTLLVAGPASEQGVTILAALRGDRKALAQLESDAEDDPAFLETVRDPITWAGRLADLLDEWTGRYATVEARVGRWLETDIAGRRGDLARYESGEMVERTTGGVRFLADASVRRVILAPSYFARPFNYIFSSGEWRLFCYPIADDSVGGTDPLGPPPAAVRLYRALGDETRLRILRLLSERDHYLTELAQQLELSKPTIKHHLAQLRAAGLVTLTEEGAHTYYSLRTERIAEAGQEALRYLER
jgi:DNA-binding transcriptional ArsR family regulator